MEVAAACLVFFLKTWLLFSAWCHVSKSDAVITSYGKKGVYESPSVRIYPGNGQNQLNMPEFDDVILTCIATGHPRPRIKWTITGGELERRPIDLTNPVLRISSIKRSEGSRVTCKAENGIGSPAFTTTRLNVYYLDKPIMTIYLSKSDPVPNHSIWYENTVILRCESRSNPAAEFSWYKSGNIIKTAIALAEGYEIRRLTYVRETTTYVFKIRNASERDYGNYECRTSLGRNGRRFDIADTKTNFTFNPQIAPPRIELGSPAKLFANPGDFVRLLCNVISGYPEPYVTWIRDTEVLSKNAAIGKKRRSLDLVNLRRSDAGAYYCVANNNVGNPVKKRVDLVVRYLDPMQYWITPDPLRDDRRLALETDVKLTCHSDAQPTDELIYSWYKKNNKGVNEPINIHIMYPNLYINDLSEAIVRKFITFPAFSSRLEISQITLDDYGKYVCQARLAGGPNGTFAESVITVTRESAPAQVFPANRKSKVTVLEGAQAVFGCKTKGTPVPQIIWLRDGNVSLSSDTRHKISTAGSYVITNVSREDADTYTCMPSRTNGFSKLPKTSFEADIDLIVNYPPEVEPKYSVMRRGLGVDLTLTCFARDAQPFWPLRYNWRKNGRLVSSLSSENLIFSPLEPNNYGVYVCDVINEAGTSSCVINVTGAAYAPEFYYRPEDTMMISSTASSVFPQNKSLIGVFVYLLSWTQKLPNAVDPVTEYRIRWRRLYDASILGDDDLPTASPWVEDAMIMRGAIEFGNLITYEIRDLASGTYEVEVTPKTIFGYGDPARRIINAKKKRGPQTTLKGPSFFCGFDDDTICGFMQETSRSMMVDNKRMKITAKDEFDWIWNSEATQTRRTTDTGPEFDHTNMSKQGGYMYIEASKTKSGQRARLVSPTFWDETSRQQCLKFFYHMKGRDIGILKVIMRTKTGKEVETWKKKNEQGNDWLSDSITLSPSLPYQFIFEATMTSDGYLGDIAVDDVVLEEGPCTTPPTITQVSMTSKRRNSRSSAESDHSGFWVRNGKKYNPETSKYLSSMFQSSKTLLNSILLHKEIYSCVLSFHYIVLSFLSAR